MELSITYSLTLFNLKEFYMQFDTAQQKQLAIQALNAFMVPLGQAQEVLKLCKGIVDAEITEDTTAVQPETINQAE